MKIPFSPPDISELEVREVARALRSGWITTGPRTKELEAKVAAFCGGARAVCLNSQTACAEMALRLLGIGPGDEVITTAYTYTATASVVCHVGAQLRLVDIGKNSTQMDWEALEKAVNPRTKAIIPVDLGGVPCDYGKIYEIVERKQAQFVPASVVQRAMGRIAILADAAHAFGAEREGTKVGSIADFTAFSFHAVKNLTTGEGGALTWRTIPGIDDERIYRELQLLSLHGQSRDALEKTRLGSWEYDVAGTWYKCNMTDIAAALGLAQLQRYPQMLARRRELICRYDEALHPLGVRTLPHFTRSYTSSGHLYMTWVPGIGEEERGRIVEKMAQASIACNVHYKPLPMHTAYQKMGFAIKDFPNAYDCYRSEITLPLHTRLTDREADYVIECYSDALGVYLP